MPAPSSDNEPRRLLDEISTRWPMLDDPAQFMLRYARAIEGYLQALVRDADLAEEIRQEFLVRLVEKGAVRTEKLHGRFRHYLKATLRNAAVTHLRKRRPTLLSEADLAHLVSPDDPPGLQQDWQSQWAACLLERVWEELDLHQRRHEDNFACLVLRTYVAHPEEDSAQLADRVNRAAGTSLRPNAYRKQLSRARRLFAEILIREIAQTLQRASAEEIEDELADLGILAQIQRFLPEDWRELVTHH